MADDGTFDDFNLKKLACEAQRPEHEYIKLPNDWRKSCKWCGHIKPHDSYATTIVDFDMSHALGGTKQTWYTKVFGF